MRYILVFLAIFMGFLLNYDSNILAHLGLEFDHDVLLIALVAMAITGLTVERRMMIVVLVCIWALVANLPTEIISGWGLDRDYLIAGLVAIVVLPILVSWLEN